MLPCACPCGCDRPSNARDTGSHVLARHARCTACSSAEHRAQHPSLAVPPEVVRPMTAPAVISSEEAALDARIAEEQRRAILAGEWARWRDSLPEKFRDADTDHPKILERLTRIESGARDVSSIVVFGNVGQGKTWLAVGYANQAIQRGLIRANQILFGTEAELLAGATNGQFSEVEPKLRRLTSRQHKMIIIDDVGRGTWLRDDMRPKVFSLVLDAAYRDNRIVVVTTNLTPQVLAEYLGKGAVDRLRAMCGYDSIRLTDDNDKRRTITQQALARTPATP